MSRLALDETEELIRRGLRRRAESAPDPAVGIRTVLGAAPPPRRSRTPLLLVAAAAAIVLAVSIGVIVRPDAPAERVTVAAPGSVLALRPAWLPDGFVERYREISADGSLQTRGWTRPDEQGQEVLLTLLPGAEEMPETLPPGGERITVGEAPGYRYTVGDTALVTWTPDQDSTVQLRVTGVPDTSAAARRIADSVEPDGTARVHADLAFGALPGGLVADTTAVRGVSPADGVDEVRAVAPGDPGRSALSAEVSDDGPAGPGGTPVRVRGLEGTYVADGVATRDLSVRLPDGRWLVLRDATDQLTREQVVAVAEDLVIGEQPDHSWLGQR
ncbi:hypothetical protein [Umezawaea beigongshangensis]|uniref:hypothetical protein n=1 Tax=Umezawaea beigongshangensis TaxID=2780383 RepID=UPI0018F25A2A|nr:hypothetical protein [Umezawaea beigongshangensis]